MADAAAMPKPTAARSTASRGKRGRASSARPASRSSCRRCTRATRRSTPRKPRRTSCRSCASWREGQRRRRPPHHRRRGADRLELQMDCLEALVADDSLFANGWTGFGMALQAYAKRARPVRVGRRAARAHGRKLMVRLVKGAYWDSEIKVAQVGGLTTIRCSPARSRPTSPTSPAPRCCSARPTASTRPSRPTMRPPSARSRRWPAHAVRVPAPARHGRGAVRGLASWSASSASRRRRCASTRRSAATRSCSPISSAACSRTAPIQQLRQPHRRRAWSLDELVRDPVARARGAEPKRNPAIPLPREMFGTARRNSAGCDLTDPPCASRCCAAAELERRSWTAGQGSGGGPGQPVHRALRPPRGRRGGRASAADVDAMLPAPPPRSPRWDALGGEARAACSTAPPTCSRSIARSSSRCASARAARPARRRAGSARGGRLPALLRRRGAAPSSRAVPLPGPTGEQNELRLHGRGVLDLHQPVELPARDLHRPGRRRARRRQCRIAKPAEQTPLIGALAVELMHRGRHSPPTSSSSRPATARSARRCRASADRRRRLHRLDRGRAADQPQRWPSATARSSR
jgi:RHH-type proline utilization regulon transcriptional repressor/proline dehydrogenase/delta 1-pyrroline-5-carboxylate dehydrogenase